MLSSWLTAVALRVEDVVEALIAYLARLRGRRHPVIIPFIGHGTHERARLGARIVLGQEAVAPSVLTPGRRTSRTCRAPRAGGGRCCGPAWPGSSPSRCRTPR